VWPEDIALTPGVIKLMQALSPEEARSEMTYWTKVGAAADSIAVFTDLVRAVKPDVLQFEEMALWPVVRRLREEGKLGRTPIIHSSYNFETVAWQHRALSGAPVNSETMRDIANFEREIAVNCDLIVTVSENDAAEFRRLGATRVCVAANGVASTALGDATSIRAYLPSEVPYALFVSSPHPPNSNGLVDPASDVAGQPIQHGEILICGRVGSLVRGAKNFKKAGRILGHARFLGWVDQSLLGPLYADAATVILPKLYSGGSNLKTAEALVSGRPLIATRRAFEGFESFADLPGIYIEDEPDAFWTAVNDRFADRSAAPVRSPEMMSGLLWRECLTPMVRAAEDLVR
jgi:glycosyltransferase involved in cell wall biosynthesis